MDEICAALGIEEPPHGEHVAYYDCGAELPAAIVQTLPKANGTITMKALCKRYTCTKKCVLWMTKPVKGIERWLLLCRILEWIGAGRNCSEAEHIVASRQIKLEQGMKPKS